MWIFSQTFRLNVWMLIWLIDFGWLILVDWMLIWLFDLVFEWSFFIHFKNNKIASSSTLKSLNISNDSSSNNNNNDNNQSSNNNLSKSTIISEFISSIGCELIAKKIGFVWDDWLKWKWIVILISLFPI